MQYRVPKVPTLGERLTLYSVAVSMAYTDATSSGVFIESVYEKALQEHIKTLVSEAYTKNVETVTQGGRPESMANIVSQAKKSGESISFTDHPGVAESLVAFSTLPMLNKWGQRFGYTFVFAEFDSHACILEEGGKLLKLGGRPDVSAAQDKPVIKVNNDTSDEGITDNLKNETPQQAASLPLEHISHKSMELKRKQAIDENKFRGAKRSIIENWDTIESLHHGTADGHKVLRILKRLDSTLNVKVKTIQNILSSFRKEGLIP